MSIKKNNAYYEPTSGLYHYDDTGEPKLIPGGSNYSAGAGIKIDDNIISVSGKYVTSADQSLSGKQLVIKDNQWEEINFPPSSDWSDEITAASAYAYTEATAWVNSIPTITKQDIDDIWATVTALD